MPARPQTVSTIPAAALAAATVFAVTQLSSHVLAGASGGATAEATADDQLSWSTASRTSTTTDRPARAAARMRGAAWSGIGVPARMAWSVARKRR